MKKQLAVLVASAALLAACGDKEEKPNVKEPEEKVDTEQPAVEEGEQQVDAAFAIYEGEIVKVNGTSLEDMSLELKQVNSDEPIHIKAQPKTLLFENGGEALKFDDLKEGDRIHAYMDSKKPVVMIYPPQYTADVITVQKADEPNGIDVAKYNDQLENDTNTLKLNESADTKITDEAGETLTWDDVKGANAVVFYGVTTRSIPAQTTPDKIVVLKTTLQP